MATMSTGLKNHLLGSSSIAGSGDLKTVLADGYLHIYADQGSNGIPTDPDAAIDTTTDYNLLATIYSDGGVADAGLELGDASNGAIQKAPGETWDNSDGGNIGAGTQTALFFVHTASGEADGTALGASTTAPRIIGSIGTSGADLNLSSVSLTNGETLEITYYSISLG